MAGGFLPKNFGGSKNRGGKSGAPGKVPTAATVAALKFKEPSHKIDPRLKRPFDTGDASQHPSKLLKLTASPNINMAAYEFGNLTEIYIDPSLITEWKSRTEEQVQESLRRAFDELFFHQHYNPSDYDKTRASLVSQEKENKRLKDLLATQDKELNLLRSEKSQHSKEIDKMKAEELRIKTELNLLCESKGIVDAKILAFQDELKVSHGFSDYLTGFLAMEPNFDFSNFGASSVKAIKAFQMENVDAIARRKEEIEAEKLVEEGR